MTYLNKPLVRLDEKNKAVYEQLMFDNSYILAIVEDHSWEDILVDLIRREPKDRWDERRKDFIYLLEMMDLSQIPNLLPV
ncbi:MAG: hypothetical protein ACK459_04155 [Akkermansiaceae bacterium]|jgi:hypothetical protein